MGKGKDKGKERNLVDDLNSSVEDNDSEEEAEDLVSDTPKCHAKVSRQSVTLKCHAKVTR